VARQLWRVFSGRARSVSAGPAACWPRKIPPQSDCAAAVEFSHLRRLDRDVGMLQHAIDSVPNTPEAKTPDRLTAQARSAAVEKIYLDCLEIRDWALVGAAALPLSGVVSVAISYD